MQGKKSQWNALMAAGILAIFVLLAWLPLASFQFAMKNDAFLYNFPNKYFFSEALHAGVLPTWNPYLNGGFPLYADPGFAWWQPLTWLFGAAGYTAYTFTIEVLTYIWLAAFGGWWLGRTLGLSYCAALAGGAAFACCGFFVGNLQHVNFLTCAAFLPWLLAAIILLHHSFKPQHVVACAGSAYLLCTGGHPAIPIASFYFGITFLATLIITDRQPFRRAMLRQLTWIPLFLLLMAPPLLSWLNLIPYYTRSEAVEQATQTELGFGWQCWFSLLSPLPTARGSAFWNTDLSMRNGYCSVVILLALIPALNYQTAKPAFKALWAGAAVGSLLALGGPIKAMLFELLPLLKYIRGNGEFRVFLLLAICMTGALGFDQLRKDQPDALKRVKSCAFALMVIAGLIALSTLLYAWTTQSFDRSKTVTTIKTIIDAADLPLFILLGACCTTLFAGAAWQILKRKRTAWLLPLIALDLLLNTWLMLPITGVGQTSVSQVQQLLNNAPKGFPIPGILIAPKFLPRVPALKVLGTWSWYNKNPVKSEHIAYPSQLRSVMPLAGNAKPFAYLNGDGTANITHFTPNEWRITVASKNCGQIMVQQYRFPGWYVQVDGGNAQPLDTPITPMTVAVNAGRHQLRFFFNPCGGAAAGVAR